LLAALAGTHRGERARGLLVCARSRGAVDRRAHLLWRALGTDVEFFPAAVALGVGARFLAEAKFLSYFSLGSLCT
jgi:hypothetical protein